MRKINLNTRRLRFQRVILKRFGNFRFKLRAGSFLKIKKKLFKRFVLRRKILLKLPSSRFIRLLMKLKLKKFYKLLIKNTQFIRRFYGDMRQNELKKWANFFRSKKKIKKKWGLTNLILKLDHRLNSYLVHNGLVNTVSQLKQYILHGKVLVNNKIIRGYNYNVNWLDHVSLKFNSNLKFNLSRIWQRFFFFKYLRLRLKSRALFKYYINFNLLDEVYYNIEKLCFFNRLTFISKFILQYKRYIKKQIRIILTRRSASEEYRLPFNWHRRRYRFILRKKIISFYYFSKLKGDKIWRNKILRKKKKLFPFFLFIRWFLLTQKFNFYLK